MSSSKDAPAAAAASSKAGSGDTSSSVSTTPAETVSTGAPVPDDADEPPAPKLDFKMLVLPAMLFLSKKVDFKDEQVVFYAQSGLTCIAVLMLTVYYFIYTRVSSQANAKKKIWVPPKAKPALPFGLGPKAEEVKASDYEETTYEDHEIKQLKEAAQGVLMSVGIAIFMSFKFKVHVSLLMQAVMLPLNAFDAMVMKKYLLGKVKEKDGDGLYEELDFKPTDEKLAKLKQVKKALKQRLMKAAGEAEGGGDAAASTTATTATATTTTGAVESKAPEVEEEPADDAPSSSPSADSSSAPSSAAAADKKRLATAIGASAPSSSSKNTVSEPAPGSEDFGNID